MTKTSQPEKVIEAETQAVAIYQPTNLAIADAPSEVLRAASEAAKALQDVIEKKPKKVRINGETYLEFEDWQTVGRFYGVTAHVEKTEDVEFSRGEGKPPIIGFLARARVIQVATGQEISAAEAMCLNDEKFWSGKPLYQLRSMAQTRACSKALRNVLSWVVVLAGYKGTPAEEMTFDEGTTDVGSGGKPAARRGRPAAAKAATEEGETTPHKKGTVSLAPLDRFKTMCQSFGQDQMFSLIPKNPNKRALTYGDIEQWTREDQMVWLTALCDKAEKVFSTKVPGEDEDTAQDDVGEAASAGLL